MVKTITPEETKAILDKTPEVQLVDVRERDEWELSHIPNALLLPLSELGKTAESILKDKDQKLILHCKTGRRSALAAMELESLGYTDVSSMDGGIEAWPYEKEKLRDWN